MGKRRIDLQFFRRLLQKEDDRTACDAVHDEFHDEVDSDDGENEDERIGVFSASDVGDDRCIVEEQTEGRHEEDSVQKSRTGRTDDGSHIPFLILDLDGIMDDAGQKTDEHPCDETHADETGKVSCLTDFAICDTALQQQSRGVHSQNRLKDGDDSPDCPREQSHPRTEDAGDDADGNSH